MNDSENVWSHSDSGLYLNWDMMVSAIALGPDKYFANTESYGFTPSPGLPTQQTNTLKIKGDILYAGLAGGGIYHLDLISDLPLTTSPKAFFDSRSRWMLSKTSDGSGVIPFYLPEAGPVDIRIESLTGQTLVQYKQNHLPVGDHFLDWPNGNLANGCYFIHVLQGAVQRR